MFSRLHFHHAGMTLPGAGFGLRVQGPNVQRMVVSALASTASFVWLGRKWPSLVLNWHVLRLFRPMQIFSEKRTFGNRHVWSRSG